MTTATAQANPSLAFINTDAENLDGWCLAPNHDVILVLTVKVEYRDIDDRKMSIDGREPKWFGRHFREKICRRPKEAL